MRPVLDGPDEVEGEFEVVWRSRMEQWDGRIGKQGKRENGFNGRHGNLGSQVSDRA